MNEDKEFKVVDRRSAARTEDSTPAEPEKTETRSGEGFVMKDENPLAGGAGPNQIDFSTLVFSLATGALIHMGVAPDPVTQKTAKNLELARQNIDILEVLRVKTKGNLTEEEDRMMESLLTEVRLKYVEASARK